MAKTDPVGKINQRADGAVWAKRPDQTWQQLKDGNQAGRAAKPTAGAGAGAGQATQQAAGAEHPWADHQRRFGLDGHLPDPRIHPQDVEVDSSGDTDTKPVLTWNDERGVQRHSYTRAFHRHRAMSHRENVAKTTTAAFRTAHTKLRTQMSTADSPRDRDAAAVALLHVTGGHRIGDLLGTHAMHVATTLPHQGGEAPDSGTPDEDTGVKVAKSSTEDVDHPHKVHMILQHPNGSLYPTSHHDDLLAEHLQDRVNTRAGADRLFECGHDDVRKCLSDVGLDGVDEGTIRHHATMHMASDKLSKLAPVDLGSDLQSGLAQVKTNLGQVSDEIAEHFGHEPAPEGMCYVPPAIAAAYIEESGGAKHWPGVFKSKADSDSDSDDLEKSACTSPSEDKHYSSEASPTTSALPDSTSTSPKRKSLRRSRTPIPSPPSSPMVEPPSSPTPSGEVTVQVSHANELDQKLTSDLHKMIGTQYPNPKNTLRKRLAETALGRGVAKVRSGELQVTELEKAHQAYKRGDYRECCQLLNYAKSASAGSSGSTGSTGSSKPARSGGTDPEAQATGNHPGPEGVPVGSVTTLSDGTREQKIGPHEWRRMGDGKHDDAGKPDAQKKQEPEKTQPARPSLKAAQDELKRLRARRKATTSRELQTELDEQIGSLRKRIAKMKRGFDASDDAGAAQRRAHQGQTASRPARDKREDVQAKKQLAKSIRDISQAYTQSTASTEIPWYEAAERAAQQEFDAFISCFGTTDDALIALAKSSPHLMVHAKSIAHASGPNGLRSYIAAKVGG